MAQLVENPPAMWQTWVRSLGWEDPLEKGKATHPSIVAWRIPWTVHGVPKSRTQLSDFHFHFPRWLSGKESTCNAGDVDSIPGSGRSPGGGHGNLVQYSYLENPMDRGDWQATVHGVAKSWAQLSKQQQPLLIQFVCIYKILESPI